MSEESETTPKEPFNWQKHDKFLSTDPNRVVRYNSKPFDWAQCPEMAKANVPSRADRAYRLFKAASIGLIASVVISSSFSERSNGNEPPAVLPDNDVEESSNRVNKPPFRVEPTADCRLTPEMLLEPIEISKAIDVVSNMQFLDNEVMKLYNVLSSIEFANSIEESKFIASNYLREKGVHVVFYSHNETQNIEFDNGLVAEPSRFESNLWNVDDSIKQEAIANTVLAFASMPKKVFDSLDRTIYYVPENFIHYGGIASSPRVGDNWHYGVAISLSNMTQPSMSILIHELLGHRVHFEVCGSQASVEDNTFSEINVPGDFRIPQSFASDYARDGGVAEDFAETVEDLMVSGIASRTDDLRFEGVLPIKQAVAAKRISSVTGLSLEEISSLGCVSAMFGHSVHPLVQVRDFPTQRFGFRELC